MSDNFLAAGLDYSAETFSPEEKESLLGWYSEVHDYGDLDLAPFVRFAIEHDPTGFKAYRRHVEEMGRTALPVGVAVLLWVYTYTALGNGKGALYEIIAVRSLGATRAEVMETIRLAALVSGPLGLNPLGELADDYLREWEEGDGAGLEWPEGWAPDTEFFRSGIDVAREGLSDEELERLREWNRRVYGEVPPSVEYAGQAAPDAYKTQQAKLEKSIRGDLPAQVIPLMQLHLGAIRQTPIPMRRAAQMARSLGVAPEHLASTLVWAAVYGGDVVFEAALDAAGELLRTFD